MKRKITALLALALIAGAMVVPAAEAQPVAAAAECTVTLQFPNPGGGNVDCTGEVLVGGGLVGGEAEVCVAVVQGCGFRAHVDAYSEPCPVPDLPLVPPLVGFANGTLHVTPAGGSEQQVGTFNWVRVGLTAVLLPAGASTAGVAAFVPHPPFGTCEAPLPLTADVVGAAVGT